MLKRRTVEAALERKGFRRREGDHSFFQYFTRDGKKSAVFTKTSHGSSQKDISKALMGRMAQQCRLGGTDFVALIMCPLSRDDYENKLREKDLL
jgi:hypothetical protein